jgi:hypothetical protein
MDSDMGFQDPLDDDLARLQQRLTGVRRRLEAQAGPVRERLEALGTAGLFALAAEEQWLADHSDGRCSAAHLGAGRAAERLAEERLGHLA